jgi:hypothetical protein
VGPVVAKVMIQSIRHAYVVLLFLCLFQQVSSSPGAESAKPPRPSVVHVTEGCQACASLLSHLKAAGTKLETKKVDRSKYPLFPTVDYTDGSYDHGERIYTRQVGVPKSLKVMSCESGS